MNEIQKTNTSVQVFNNSNFGEVRTSWIEEKPFFCLVDVCRALELENPSKIASGLDKKGVTISYTLTPKGMQNLLFVNEPNLYRCVFRSRKENAIVFQNWIFEEVIPEIRKTGGYGKQMSKAEMRMQVFLDMQAEIDRQSNVIKKQGKRITALLGKLESEALAREQKKLEATHTRDERIMEKVRTMLEANPIIEDTSLCDLHKQFISIFAFDEEFDISNKMLSSVLRKMGYRTIRKSQGTFFKSCIASC